MRFFLIFNITVHFCLISAFHFKPFVKRKLFNAPQLRNSVESQSESMVLQEFIDVWLREAGGFSKCQVSKLDDGALNLLSKDDVPQGEQLSIVPSQLCFFPQSTVEGFQPSDTIQKLQDSFDVTQWRVRLALVALYAFNTDDVFSKYVTYTAPSQPGCFISFLDKETMRLFETYPVVGKISLRRSFLNEFADKVITRLTQTEKQVYSRIEPGGEFSVSSLLFSAVTGGAVRDPLCYPTPLFIPTFDLLRRGKEANCQIRSVPNGFALTTTRPVRRGEALVLADSLDNDVRLMDFGYSIDDNDCERVAVSLSPQVVNAARDVVGEFDSGSSPKASPLSAVWPWDQHRGTSIHGILNNVSFDYLTLSGWQLIWLDILKLAGPYDHRSADLGCRRCTASASFSSKTDIEAAYQGISIAPSHAWTLFRILYSPSEASVTEHGFDPFLLSDPLSCLRSEVELRVIRSMVGLAALGLVSLGGGSLVEEIEALRTGSLHALTAKILSSESSMVDKDLDDLMTIKLQQPSTRVAVIASARRVLADVLAHVTGDANESVKELMVWNGPVHPAIKTLEQSTLWFRIHKKRTLVKVLFDLHKLYQVHLLHSDLSPVLPSSSPTGVPSENTYSLQLPDLPWSNSSSALRHAEKAATLLSELMSHINQDVI